MTVMSPIIFFSDRFDYLLISHFLLKLQDVSVVTYNSSYLSRSSPAQPDLRQQVSSIRFAANTLIGDLGAPLRDGLNEDDADAAIIEIY